MLRKLWRWLTTPRPLSKDWHELYRYGVSPWHIEYTFAHYDGEGGWWQYQPGGVLWQRFDPTGWSLVGKSIYPTPGSRDG